MWYSHIAMYCTCPFVRVGLAGEQNLRQYSRDFSVTLCLSYVHLHFLYLCCQYIFAIHTLGLLLFSEIMNAFTNRGIYYKMDVL